MEADRHPPASSSPPAAAPTGVVADDLRARVARRLADDSELAGAPADRAALRRAVARALAAEGLVVAPHRWAQLVRELVDDLGGLGPLEPLLRDPDVTDVLVNAPDDLWVERAGELVRVPASFRDADHVIAAVRRVLTPLGIRWDRSRPWADAVLDGGIRLHALLPPVVVEPTVTLRRVPAVVPSWDELEADGSVPPAARRQLCEAVAAGRNLVISGPAGVGKTTLLARLLDEASDERTVVIEDAPELVHPAPHRVHLRVVPATADGAGAVTLAELVRQALRMRPDRLVVGEVRGREVADVLQALNTGHRGMTTVHANSAEDALVRLEGMALLAGIPTAAAHAQVSSAVDLVVAMGRDSRGGRRVERIVEVVNGASGRRVRPRWHHEGLDATPRRDPSVRGVQP